MSRKKKQGEDKKLMESRGVHFYERKYEKKKNVEKHSAGELMTAETSCYCVILM